VVVICQFLCPSWQKMCELKRLVYNSVTNVLLALMTLNIIICWNILDTCCGWCKPCLTTLRPFGYHYYKKCTKHGLFSCCRLYCSNQDSFHWWTLTRLMKTGTTVICFLTSTLLYCLSPSRIKTQVNMDHSYPVAQPQVHLQQN